MLAFQRVLLARLTERRIGPREDALSAIVATLAPGDEPLKFLQEAVLRSAAQGLVLPGHSTSVAMIGNGLVRLFEHPEQWELLTSQPHPSPRVRSRCALLPRRGAGSARGWGRLQVGIALEPASDDFRHCDSCPNTR